MVKKDNENSLLKVVDYLKKTDEKWRERESFMQLSHALYLVFV